MGQVLLKICKYCFRSTLPDRSNSAHYNPKLYHYFFYIITLLITYDINAQSNEFSLPTYWGVNEAGLAYNIETADINRDGNLDIITGNFNSTYVYFGGQGILDSTVDVIYNGRCLAVCDYNGDGFDDLIAMHFTNYDSIRHDYDGEFLYYYGGDTTALAIDTIPEYSTALPTLYPTGERLSIGLFKVGIDYGDFNNDGKYDFALNSDDYGLINLGSRVGKVYIYMGKDAPVDTADFAIEGDSILDDYGKYFDIGNINGDQYDDFLVSARINTIPPLPMDSLHLLYIYYGNENFQFVKYGESVKYESRINYSEEWSEWFRQNFSVDDINSDGIDDVVIGGIGRDDLRDSTKIHFGTVSGIDTIPDFAFTDPDTTDEFVSSGGISQNIGDFNDDGYDDFVFEGGFKLFILRLGGPHMNNINPYGVRGLSEAGPFFPNKALNVGDQNGDGVKDFIASAVTGYVIMMLGNSTVHTDVKNEGSVIKGFRLYQNYPNPFNPVTMIRFRSSEFGIVNLKVYDVLGNEIATLVNEEMPAGEYEVEFNAENLASGIYLYQLGIEKTIITKKMILLK